MFSCQYCTLSVQTRTGKESNNAPVVCLQMSYSTQGKNCMWAATSLVTRAVCGTCNLTLCRGSGPAAVQEGIRSGSRCQLTCHVPRLITSPSQQGSLALAQLCSSQLWWPLSAREWLFRAVLTQGRHSWCSLHINHLHAGLLQIQTLAVMSKVFEPKKHIKNTSKLILPAPIVEQLSFLLF